jgi:hypothetical protein
LGDSGTEGSEDMRTSDLKGQVEYQSRGLEGLPEDVGTNENRGPRDQSTKKDKSRV